MSSTINRFYEEYAREYELLSRDRDFDREVRAISCGMTLNKSVGPSLLELCAGPAYHALAFLRQAWNDVLCVDGSREMKKRAVAAGIPDDRYVLGRIPESLQRIPEDKQFDIITLMRYSIGYLDRPEVRCLFEWCRYRLRRGGRLVLELHSIPLLMKGLHNLSIRARTCELPDGQEFYCCWPSGELSWDANDWVVSMPVLLEWRSQSIVVKSEELISRERIYTAAELIDIARNDTFNVIDDPVLREFDGSSLLCLERR